MTDSIVFYRSYYDAVKGMPPEEFKKCITALLEYGLNGVEEPEGTTATMYLTLTKPLLDANATRRTNGKKGGRPKRTPEDDFLKQIQAEGYERMKWGNQ